MSKKEYLRMKRELENIKLFLGLSVMFVLVPGSMILHWLACGY